MRLVISPKFDPEGKTYNDPTDELRCETEFFEGSGNVHVIVDETIDQVYDSAGGDCLIHYTDAKYQKLENYTMTSFDTEGDLE